MRNFKDKLIIVTGASGGLGQAIVEELISKSATVVGIDLFDDQMKIMKEQHKNQFHFFACDITDFAKSKEIYQQILKLGKPYALFNNAGITNVDLFSDAVIEPLKKVMNVNLFGAANWTGLALDHIKFNQGIYVNTSSVAGFAPLLRRTAYAASKHAMHGFFESLRAELKDFNVQVLMVCPTFISTAIRSSADSPGNHDTTGKIITPKFVAQKIVKAAEQNKRLAVIGKTAVQSYWMHKLFPAFYEKLMVKKLKDL
jgi:short-subunit dehydrogenase